MTSTAATELERTPHPGQHRRAGDGDRDGLASGGQSGPRGGKPLRLALRLGYAACRRESADVIDTLDITTRSAPRRSPKLTSLTLHRPLNIWRPWRNPGGAERPTIDS